MKDKDWYDRMMATIYSFDKFYKDKGISKSGIWDAEEDELPPWRMPTPVKPSQKPRVRPMRGAVPNLSDLYGG